MKGLFYSLLLILFIFSCNNSDETISDATMVDILTDMLIADELLVKYGGSTPNLYRDSIKMMILERYSFEETEFDEMIMTAQKDLKYYHGLQSKVADRLDSLKSITDQ